MFRAFLAHRPRKTGHRLDFPLDVGDSGFSKTIDTLAMKQLMGLKDTYHEITFLNVEFELPLKYQIETSSCHLDIWNDAQRTNLGITQDSAWSVLDGDKARDTDGSSWVNTKDWDEDRDWDWVLRNCGILCPDWRWYTCVRNRASRQRYQREIRTGYYESQGIRITS